MVGTTHSTMSITRTKGPMLCPFHPPSGFPNFCLMFLFRRHLLQPLVPHPKSPPASPILPSGLSSSHIHATKPTLGQVHTEEICALKFAGLTESPSSSPLSLPHPLRSMLVSRVNVNSRDFFHMRSSRYNNPLSVHIARRSLRRALAFK